MGHACEFLLPAIDGNADAGANEGPKLPVVPPNTDLTHADRVGKKWSGR